MDNLNILARMISDITSIDYNILHDNITMYTNEIPISKTNSKAKRCDFIIKFNGNSVINIDNTKTLNYSSKSMDFGSSSGIVNKDICKALFAFLCDKERTDVKSFVNSLSVQDLLEFCNENVLPQAMLSLYGMGEILIENWNSENGFNMKPQGEFELAWWLKEIPVEQLNMKKIIVTKLDEVFPIRLVLGDNNCDIEMTNFELRIIR